MKTNSPWASGPGEILKHGLELLSKESDTNRRLAMISIDNAVELMIKTYLGLPKRVNGLNIPRREFAEISESFPSLLDALEKHAIDKLDGIELGEIEWYHRLRNQLYHQGNGLTVERDKVEIYSQLAITLFRNLFGEELDYRESRRAANLNHFMTAWVNIERGVRELARQSGPAARRGGGLYDALRFIKIAGLMNSQEIEELESLRRLRNEIVHGTRDWSDALTAEILDRVSSYSDRFSKT